MRRPGGLFGRHVGRGAQNAAVGSHCQLARIALRQTEVHHVGPLLTIEYDVRGLDVAMNDPLFMRILQRVRQLASDSCRLRRRERPGLEPFFQRGSVDVLANEKPDVILGTAGFVQRNDRRVLELGSAAGLAHEPLGLILGREAAGALHFERDHPFQPRIPRSKYIAKRADAELRLQLESIEPHFSFQQATAPDRVPHRPRFAIAGEPTRKPAPAAPGSTLRRHSPAARCRSLWGVWRVGRRVGRSTRPVSPADLRNPAQLSTWRAMASSCAVSPSPRANSRSRSAAGHDCSVTAAPVASGLRPLGSRCDPSLRRVVRTNMKSGAIAGHAPSRYLIHSNGHALQSGERQNRKTVRSAPGDRDLLRFQTFPAIFV